MMKPKPMFHVGIGGNDPAELLGGKVVSRGQWGQVEPTALISDPAGNLLDVFEVNVSQQSQLIDRAQSEPLFQCPPFNASILNAIMLIAPQFQMLTADEDSRKLWELAQNAAC